MFWFICRKNNIHIFDTFHNLDREPFPADTKHQRTRTIVPPPQGQTYKRSYLYQDKHDTVCPRNSDPFYVVAYFIKLITTS